MTDSAQIETEPAGSMPRAFWYIARASSQLRDAPVAVQVMDQQIVLFRDSAGRAHALLDRCCHRGVELSLGKMEGDAIACGYHGWRFAGDGACVHIPSLTAEREIPKGCDVRSFPCAERDGYVWIWPDAIAPSPTEPPPIPDFASKAWFQGSIAHQCHPLAGIENNVDWCHPVFAHPYTHGAFFANQAMGFQEQRYEMRATPSGLIVFAPPTASADDPIPAGGQITLRFDLPDRVTVSFGAPFAMTIVLHFVPTGEHSCRLEWLTTVPNSAGAEHSVGWSEDEPIIFKQDRILMESAERARARHPQLAERSVEADVSTLMVRRIVALAAAGRWDAERTRLPQRRIVSVRA